MGVSEDDLPRVLQTFPLVFAVPLARMRDVVAFLSEDLTINDRDIAKIIRYAILCFSHCGALVVVMLLLLMMMTMIMIMTRCCKMPPLIEDSVDATREPQG